VAAPAERLARYLRITPAQFLAATPWKTKRRAGFCGATCTVYDARPDACQRFPHVVRGAGSIASRMWQFVDRAVYCPIVYKLAGGVQRGTGVPAVKTRAKRRPLPARGGAANKKRGKR
jgi:hypothetical protein